MACLSQNSAPTHDSVNPLNRRLAARVPRSFIACGRRRSLRARERRALLYALCRVRSYVQWLPVQCSARSRQWMRPERV